MATAEERSIELLYIPQGELPKLALACRNRLANRVGLCIEVCRTAFEWYAIVCEGVSGDIDETQPEVVWLRSLVCNIWENTWVI